MRFDAKLFVRAFSPRFFGKALQTLDRSTAVVITTCWLAAFVILVLAVVAVHGAVEAKKQADEAIAAEPILPKINNSPIAPREFQNIVDRLQRQFPDIMIEIKQGQYISIRSEDGSKFHQWITALNYIDTMAPQYRWTLREFCAGSCGGAGLMSASLSGQRITFAAEERQ